jgi:hypothetical protein
MRRKSNSSITASQAEQVTALTLELESRISISLILNMRFPHFGQEGIVIVSSRREYYLQIWNQRNHRDTLHHKFESGLNRLPMTLHGALSRSRFLAS